MNYILSLFCLMTISGFGQTVEPLIGSVEHNDAQRICLVVTLDPSTDEVADEWEDFLKQDYSIKLKGAGFLGTGNLLVAEQVVLPAISPNRLDFYTNIEEKDERTEMKVFAAFGTDVYVEPKKYPQEYKAMKSILTSFLKDYLPKYYQSQVVTIQKNMQSLTKEGDKLDKKQQKNKEKIEDLQEDLDENSEAQKVNAEQQAATQKLLEKRKRALEVILKQIGKL